MLRRLAKYAICGSQSDRSDDENNKITDSLEQCLLLEKGVKEFQTFLKRGKFEDDAALEFYLKCGTVLSELSKCSPSSRNQAFSKKLNGDVCLLYEMAGGVNFDQHQMEALEETFRNGTDEDKIERIAEAQKWSMEVLQDIYETFRKDYLNTKT